MLPGSIIELSAFVVALRTNDTDSPTVRIAANCAPRRFRVCWMDNGRHAGVILNDAGDVVPQPIRVHMFLSQRSLAAKDAAVLRSGRFEKLGLG